MKHHYMKITILAPAVLLAVTLASCGGGGSGSTLIAPYQNVVTNIPAPSAGYNSDETAVLTQLTDMRLGAGYLTPNKALNTAASNHVNFLISNNLLSPGYLTTLQSGGILGGHYENAAATNLTYYTGASPQDRAIAAGYNGTVEEVITFSAATTTGTDCVNSLGDSVYHVIDLISPFIDLGVSFQADSASSVNVCAIEMGVASTTLGQLPVSGPVVYPYNGLTNVLPTYYIQAEAPSPTTLVGAGPFGHPAVVSLYTWASPVLSSGNIVIHDFSISTGGGATLPAQVLANSGVTSTPITGPALTADNVIPRPGFVVLVPTSPLTPGTTYDISFSATVNGQSVNKTWSFTTGPQN
jgi:hypothetical protein